MNAQNHCYSRCNSDFKIPSDHFFYNVTSGFLGIYHVSIGALKIPLGIYNLYQDWIVKKEEEIICLNDDNPVPNYRRPKVSLLNAAQQISIGSLLLVHAFSNVFGNKDNLFGNNKLSNDATEDKCITFCTSLY